MPISVITFDLDNTLWDVDSVIRRAEKTMRAWLHERVPEYSEITPEIAMSIRRQLVADDSAIAHDLSRLRTEVMFEAIRHFGYPAETARAHAEGAFEVFIHGRHDIVYFEGALTMLDTLAGRYQLGALTNGNADFQRLGLDKYFSFGFSSADVGASKPDPAMFHAALAHTGAQPKNVVHVGDNPVDDVDGAAAIGIHTIWVNHEDQDTEVAATVEVNHLDDVPNAISGIAGR